MAATLVGGSFLNSTLNVLFDRLSSREVINFFRGRKHDERLLKKLKLKLLGLNTVLNDAENKQFTDRAVKEWLDKIKGAVYDTEDLVDEIATEALRCKVEAEYQSGPNQVQSLFSSSTKLFGDEIESKLERMIDFLEDFMSEKYVLGLREVTGRYWSQTRLPSTSVVVESCVYGRETDKEKIMKLLLSDGESSNGLDVIPIVGMGGVGKSTLAQLLYNDGRLDGHFVKKAWVCVSDVFDVLSITRTIVKKVTGLASDAKDLDSLHLKLKESLSGKKFLIVLDNVWNENYEHWDVLTIPFKFGARGSKIIVTTRNEKVASIMKTVPIHGLKELPEEDSWMLFSEHAFEKGDCINAHPDLEKIGKEIVKKCKGLPLAAKTLGGLLRSQRDVKEWNNILESAIWELSEQKSNILPALRLSYHFLPSHLKRCFAFCSVFIKDYEFDMKELVLIWMAQGFMVKPKNNKTVEEEGYECFRELLSRSFFQKSNANDSYYVMHDLVHDLAQHVMGDFCYRLKDDKPCGTSENVRHFSYVRWNFDGIDKLKVIKDAKCLRTFLQIDFRTNYYKWWNEKVWLSNKALDEIISRMPRLRLLSLPYYKIKKLPYSIGKLIYLRLLDLSYSQITQLPESVCTLYNLETLLLSHCRSLKTLPTDLVKLISLRHLDLSETSLKEMPVNISRFKDLQRLTTFVVGKCSGSGINGMKELNSLCGAITISGLENVTSGDDALEAKLKEKKHLERLTLEWGSTAEDSEKERDVLENLEPPTNLKLLVIKNYVGTKFPTWLGDQPFGNMVWLSLVECENCFSLPPLGQMPSLQSLRLSKCPKIESFPEGGLPSSLTNLFISECKKLKSLPEQMHTLLPSLESLNLHGCPEIESFPEGGLPSSLTNLFISECKKLKSLPEQMHTLLPSLESLNLPEGGLPSSLTNLFIRECKKLKSLPEQMHTLLPSLESLDLYDCPEIESFPEGGLPSKLRRLHINDCKKLVGGRRNWGLQTLPSLTHFFLNGESEDVLESFPEEGLLPPTLTCLNFGYMPDLKSLNGRGLQPLVSLESMTITNCPQLQSLSVERLPTSLSKLTIWHCPLLEPRCRRGEGEDWHKIAHIPFIDIY